MMRLFALSALMLYCAVPAYAEELPEASLFFSPQEAHEARTLARQRGPTGQGNIALGAVLFYTSNDWVLWIQGQRWTPETTRNDLRVLAVTPDSVKMAWRDDDNTKHVFTLRPNQAYQIATGKIITQP